MPRFSDQQETFGLLLHTIRLGLIRRAEQFLANKGFDFKFIQLRVLKQLSMHQSQSATELARAVEHDGGALTRVLDRLQESGYVVRRSSALDRRVIELSLTDEGRALWNSIQPWILQLNADALSALDGREQEQLFFLLHRVRARLEE
jgi:DNA-binding MarR family transcriptional regulator